MIDHLYVVYFTDDVRTYHQYHINEYKKPFCKGQLPVLRDLMGSYYLRDEGEGFLGGLLPFLSSSSSPYIYVGARRSRSVGFVRRGSPLPSHPPPFLTVTRRPLVVCCQSNPT